MYKNNPSSLPTFLSENYDILDPLFLFLFIFFPTVIFYPCLISLVIKRPGVKDFLGVPKIPVAPPSTLPQQPAFSFFDAIKKYAAAQQQLPKPASSPVVAPKPTHQRITSSSVISQRLKSLEKEVKGRKKGKKR